MHATRAERAWELCEQYVKPNVQGVFFAPLRRGIRVREGIRTAGHRRHAIGEAASRLCSIGLNVRMRPRERY